MANSIFWLNSVLPAFSIPPSLTIMPLTIASLEGSATIERGPLVLAGVLLSLVVIYVAGKVGSEICTRINLPPVLGELVGGVIVGVSALHLLMFPEAGVQSSPSVLSDLLRVTTGASSQTAIAAFQTYSEVISVLAELGIVILLFEIGLQSNLQELIQVGPQSAVVAVVGVATPLISGTLGLVSLFHVPIIPAIFVAAALTETSIGITAKVLSEIQRLSSREGQIIIGAAVLDDILGIILLTVVASLAKTGKVEVANALYLILSSVGFLIGTVVLSRFFSRFFVALVNRLKTRGGLLISSLVFAFTLSYIATAIHLEAILGAFTAGLVLAETEKQQELEAQVIPIADMLVPVFFVTIGAKTDLSVLNLAVPSNREGLMVAIFLIVVAILGKLVTGFAVFGQSQINRLAVGTGMLCRGEVSLVYAGVGSTSGVLTKPLEVAIIVMVISTIFIGPPLLRIVFQEETPKIAPS